LTFHHHKIKVIKVIYSPGRCDQGRKKRGVMGLIHPEPALDGDDESKNSWEGF